MKEIVENALADINQQVEDAKAKLNQLVGAQSVLKIVLEQSDKPAEDNGENQTDKPRNRKRSAQ